VEEKDRGKTSKVQHGTSKLKRAEVGSATGGLDGAPINRNHRFVLLPVLPLALLADSVLKQVGIMILFVGVVMVGSLIYAVLCGRYQKSEAKGQPVPTWEEHEHPVLGKYRRLGTRWWADAEREGSEDGLRLFAPGPEPTEEQLARFAEIESRLRPFLSALSPLVAPPENDGYGKAWGDPDLGKADLGSIDLLDDGAFKAGLCPAGQTDFFLALIVMVDREWKIQYLEWSA
jgi:hypothetical protein